jgi:hypothetical protein
MFMAHPQICTQHGIWETLLDLSPSKIRVLTKTPIIGPRSDTHESWIILHNANLGVWDVSSIT